MKTMRIKGICVNIDKTRSVSKLSKLKQLCQDELDKPENYKGHHKLLSMYVELISLRIGYMEDIDYALEIDTIVQLN
tara:strand:+ start:262 stop:492 length:231 start_codon:yes stop_codon:yes gene_type:complete